MNTKRLNTKFYTDQFLAKTKYLEGNTGAWIYTTGKFTVAYPCTNLSEVGDTLQQFADDVGIPDQLSSDLASEITGNHTEFQDKVKCLRIDLTHSEVERSNQNHVAEGKIGHQKKCFCQNMVSKKVPKRLCDYGLVHQDSILSRIACGKTG